MFFPGEEYFCYSFFVVFCLQLLLHSFFLLLLNAHGVVLFQSDLGSHVGDSSWESLLTFLGDTNLQQIPSLVLAITQRPRFLGFGGRDCVVDVSFEIILF